MTGRLEILDVTTAYDEADVLQGVSLMVEAGSITCLLGSNGSGKTTLIRSILGLTPPRAGRVVFDRKDITGLPTHKVIAAGVACIPEGRKVFPKLTVEENLRVGAYQEPSEAVTRTRAEEIYRELRPALAEPGKQASHLCSSKAERFQDRDLAAAKFDFAHAGIVTVDGRMSSSGWKICDVWASVSRS